MTNQQLAWVLFSLRLQIHQLCFPQVRFRQHDPCFQMLQKPAHFLYHLNLEKQLVLCFCLLFCLLVFVRLSCIFRSTLELRKAALTLEVQVFACIRKVKPLLNTGIFRKHFFLFSFINFLSITFSLFNLNFLLLICNSPLIFIHF